MSPSKNVNRISLCTTVVDNTAHRSVLIVLPLIRQREDNQNCSVLCCLLTVVHNDTHTQSAFAVYDVRQGMLNLR